MQNELVLHGELARKGLAAFMEREAPGTEADSCTWFVLINSERALFYRRHLRGLEFMGGATPNYSYENKSSGYPMVGSPHASRDGNTVRHFTTAPSQPTPTRHEEFMFLCRLSDYLDDVCRQDAFDDMVLIAAPETLNMLRGILSERVEERVRLQLSRDLVNMPAAHIRHVIEKEASF